MQLCTYGMEIFNLISPSLGGDFMILLHLLTWLMPACLSASIQFLKPRKFRRFIFVTNLKPRGIPPSACSGTFLEILCRWQSHLGSLSVCKNTTCRSLPSAFESMVGDVFSNTSADLFMDETVLITSSISFISRFWQFQKPQAVSKTLCSLPSLASRNSFKPVQDYKLDNKVESLCMMLYRKSGNFCC